MMAKFGFEDSEHSVDLGDLPISSRREHKSKLDKDIIESSEKLGFKDRSGLKVPTKRKPGRKKQPIERSQVLITGPADVIEEFKKFCISDGDIPYWEGLRNLLRVNSE